MKNIENGFRKSAEFILKNMVKPVREYIEAYKSDSWKKDRYTYIRELNELYENLQSVRDGRLNYCCKHYDNLESLPKEEIELQTEINDILVEIYKIKKEIDNELNKEGGW
jgi:hypothetical protein